MASLSGCDLFQASLTDYLQEAPQAESPPGNGNKPGGGSGGVTGGSGSGNNGVTEPWVYVAVGSGDDGKSGRSPAEAVKTLGKALDIWAGEGSTEARIMLVEDIALSLGYNDPEALTVNGLVDFSMNLLAPVSRSGISAITLAGSGNGKTIDNEAAGARPVLYVTTPGMAITLKNLTITGGRGDYGAGIHIGGGTVVTMAEGLTITDNLAPNDGGGVYVDGVGSEFIMTGGEIHRNKALGASSGKGGGVCVGTNGTFTMEGGSIRNNESGNGGGGIYVSGVNSKALIRGGAVGGASSADGNRAMFGGGVYVGDNGRLELGLADGSQGPVIRYNMARNMMAGTGGGVAVNGAGALAHFYQGTVSQNTSYTGGGGVLVARGNLDMRGGTVTGNSAATGKGPGIMVENTGTLEMSKNARALADPVHLSGTDRRIQIGEFTGDSTAGIAKVTTERYPANTPILWGSPGHIGAYYTRFDVDGKGMGTSLDSTGKLLP